MNLFIVGIFAALALSGVFAHMADTVTTTPGSILLMLAIYVIGWIFARSHYTSSIVRINSIDEIVLKGKILSTTILSRSETRDASSDTAGRRVHTIIAMAINERGETILYEKDVYKISHESARFESENKKALQLVGEAKFQITQLLQRLLPECSIVCTRT